MDNVLLIFEHFDRIADVYLVTDAPDWLLECHGKMLNINAESKYFDYLIRVSDAICDSDNTEHFFNKDDDLAGAWVKYKLDGLTHVDCEFKIVICGAAH